MRAAHRERGNHREDQGRLRRLRIQCSLHEGLPAGVRGPRRRFPLHPRRGTGRSAARHGGRGRAGLPDRGDFGRRVNPDSVGRVGYINPAMPRSAMAGRDPPYMISQVVGRVLTRLMDLSDRGDFGRGVTVYCLNGGQSSSPKLSINPPAGGPLLFLNKERSFSPFAVSSIMTRSARGWQRLI